MPSRWHAIPLVCQCGLNAGSHAKDARVLTDGGGELQAQRQSFAMGIGIEIAGVPSAVQGAFMRASPVNDRPSGGGPVAAGTRMTEVVSYRSATRARHSVDVPACLVVARHGNLKPLPHETSQRLQAIAVLLEPLPRGIVHLHRSGSPRRPRPASRERGGDIDVSNDGAALPENLDSVVEGRGHLRLDRWCR